MTPATRARLFAPTHAFDHPVSLWITIGVVAVLALAPVIILGLAAARKISPELRAKTLRIWRSWLLIAPAMLIPVLLGAAYTIAALLLLSLQCSREFARATGLFRERTVSLIIVLGIFGLAFAAFDNYYRLFVALSPLTLILIAAVAVLPDQPKGYIQRVGLASMGFLFFGTCLLHLAFIANDRDYRPILLMLFVTVELNDVFAFIWGKRFGRRRLSPNTSPNKTMGGSLGALVLTTALAAALGHFVFLGSPVDGPIPLIALGLIISVAGQFGDLMLSSVKRDIGIKDFSSAIPGHGGFLDRFDSLILVAPAAFHYLNYMRGIGVGEPIRIFTSP